MDTGTPVIPISSSAITTPDVVESFPHERSHRHRAGAGHEAAARARAGDLHLPYFGDFKGADLKERACLGHLDSSVYVVGFDDRIPRQSIRPAFV